MGRDAEVPCVGNPQALKVNGCAFPATAVIVVDDVPVTPDGQVGTIVVTACSLHVRQVLAFLQDAYGIEGAEVTVAPAEDRQLVVDSLELSGRNVWELQAA